jgi:hypothetical protein
MIFFFYIFDWTPYRYFSRQKDWFFCVYVISFLSTFLLKRFNFFFSTVDGGGGGYFLRGTIWRYFLIVRESKNVGFFLGIQKFHHLFSSRSLRYFGLLSCNWALRHIESIENQNVVIVFGQSNNVALRGNLQATAPRYFHLK